MALRALAKMDVRSSEVIDWLENRTVGWDEFHEQYHRQLARERLLAFSRAMIPFPWSDVDACDTNLELQARAHASYGQKVSGSDQPTKCPSCGNALSWIYFESPAWTWQESCGRAGWLAICRACGGEVDFEMTKMN